MRMFSVLVNSGADPTLEDSAGHNAQYYMDNQSEVVIPEWTNRWSNMITAQDRSPSPERRRSERQTAKAKTARASALHKAAKSARRKKRDGKLNFHWGGDENCSINCRTQL